MPPPMRHLTPWRLADGRGAALPNAIFNVQICPAATHLAAESDSPRSPRWTQRPFLIHLVRGRGSLGRCAFSYDWASLRRALIALRPLSRADATLITTLALHAERTRRRR